MSVGPTHKLQSWQLMARQNQICFECTKMEAVSSLVQRSQFTVIDNDKRDTKEAWPILLSNDNQIVMVSWCHGVIPRIKYIYMFGFFT
mmetsp:Transcript_9141/g.11435  ORF Transcript_9141/g.11435 Transcript_9141/m.11435 type:complete len:88 (-) Transcript_9141:1028-1291(-)